MLNAVTRNESVLTGDIRLTPGGFWGQTFSYGNETTVTKQKLLRLPSSPYRSFIRSDRYQ